MHEYLFYSVLFVMNYKVFPKINSDKNVFHTNEGYKGKPPSVFKGNEIKGQSSGC